MSPLYAIIELTGAPGVGKTTLSHTLGDELAPAGILYVDASPDQKLTLTMAPDQPDMTLGRLFGHAREATATREAIDWAFSDLVVSVGETQDLLTVGALSDELTIAEREKLHYGLSRLIEPYDYVIVDGFHPLLHALLPTDSLHTLMVLTPAHMRDWLPPVSPAATPSLVLNQYHEEPLSANLEQGLLQGQVKLIGKLPRYESPEACLRQLPEDFRNCLLRMNLPLNLGA